MATATDQAPVVIEIVPSGQRQGHKGLTSHYDTICSRCGIISTGDMYPTAAKERADHLCIPRRARRG